MVEYGKPQPRTWQHSFYCSHCGLEWQGYYRDDNRLDSFCPNTTHPKVLCPPYIVPGEDD